MNKIFIILIISILVGYWWWNKDGEVKVKSVFVNQTEIETEISLQLFEELTVPYLRSRKYQGNILERKKYQDKPNYTSYITSYLSDGLKINALLTIPKGEIPEKGWPAVVFVHGYIPPTLYRTTERYVDYVDYLARNDLVVLKIDLRGHGQSEGEAEGAYYGSDYIIDTLNAYRALQNMEGVNKGRVNLWGHSMAGNVLMRAAVVEKTIPKVVIWAGAVYSYSDMVKYGISDNSYRPPSNNEQRMRKRQQLFDTYGRFDEKSEFWTKVVPLNYLDGVSTRFSIHHSVDDRVVKVDYSRDLIKKLQEEGKSVEYFEYKNGGHNIDGSSFGLAMNRVVEFLSKN